MTDEYAGFRTHLGKSIFYQKYALDGNDSWAALAARLVNDVCGGDNPVLSKDDRDELTKIIELKQFIPGGRYLYYAGRPLHAWNNCYLLKGEEDTREEWGLLLKRASDCLMNGGGIGVDYSIFRSSGAVLARTGGIASGPLPLMNSVNEVGRNVMQGGSRRSAIYASLNWQHGDAGNFLAMKNWFDQPVGTTGQSYWDIKQQNFNFPCPLDMTNVSLNYDDAWLNTQERHLHPTFIKNVEQALKTGEPGFSFNFGAKQNETLRNACVVGTTRLLTKNGYVEIRDVVNKEVEIWNGKEWSQVTPFSTGENDLVHVEFDNGASIICTPYHKFILAGNIKVCADELDEGDRLEKFPMPVVDNSKWADYDVDAYSQGFYSGDGNTDYEYSYLYEPKYCCEHRLVGTMFKDTPVRKRWKHGPMYGKNWVPLDGSLNYRLNWLAGICDSDGTVTRDENGNGIQITSIDHSFLEEIRLLLSTLGVNAKIVSGNPAGFRTMPDGRGGSKEYECKETRRLLIGNSDTYSLLCLGLQTSRLQLHSNPPQRDARRFVRVKAVNPVTGDFGFPVKAETFCVTEPLLNNVTFNGIVTGNCCEVVSEDDSDVCNLGSVNMANIPDLSTFKKVVELGTKFLVCGTLRADLPYKKIYKVREKNRRLGLGLMGIHEWLLKRNYGYEVTSELHEWLGAYRDVSESAGTLLCNSLGISSPVAFRAIAPTGTIGILAGTTTGIEPLFAVAYKRRYLKYGIKWHYEYAVDATAETMIKEYGVDPNKIETAYSLSNNPEKRIKFQADIQDYVDMAISSTINMPAWGSRDNNEDKVADFAATLSRYAARLRGFTCYPDGSRGGQPITEVPYEEASKHKGVVFEENQDKQCSSGICGI